jgi:hypothetical protein
MVRFGSVGLLIRCFEIKEYPIYPVVAQNDFFFLGNVLELVTPNNTKN